MRTLTQQIRAKSHPKGWGRAVRYHGASSPSVSPPELCPGPGTGRREHKGIHMELAAGRTHWAGTGETQHLLQLAPPLLFLALISGHLS